jgi:hypothetical protein
MPGSVSNAAPTDVLPWGLCTAFAHSREYIASISEYPDGSSQRGRLAETSRKSWRQSRRLTATGLATLYTFYQNHINDPFYFYDPWASGFTYDETGEQTLGRYTVRFDGEWNQSMGIARGEAGISLVELA